MKYRLGFVSNSSSCSFVCPKCNDGWIGWDWDEDPTCPNCGISIYDSEYGRDDILKTIGRVEQCLNDKKVKQALTILRELLDKYGRSND